MSATITIQLSPGALTLTEKFRNAPETFPQAIKRGMDKALAITAGRIQEQRLTGKGPFPVELHRLGERTGQLKLRTRSTAAVITTTGGNAEVTGAIGSSVKYAEYQEFGTKTLPERAPFRTGIKDNADYIAGTIQKEIETSFL